MPSRTTRKFIFGAAVLLSIAAGIWPLLPDEDVNSRFALVLSEMDRGDVNHVSELLRDLEQDSEFQDHVHVLDAAIHVRNGHFAVALAALSGVTPSGPLRIPVYYYAGRALHGLNRLSEAHQALTVVVKEAPEYPEGHRWLGVVYYDLGALEFAIQELTRLSQLLPDDYRPHRLIGLIHRDFDHHQDAIASYSAALKRDLPPEVRGEVELELADVLIKVRRYDDARLLVKNARSSAFAHILLARCEWNAGRVDISLAEVEKALLQNPQERTAYQLKAEILQSIRRHSDAIQCLRKAVELHPFDAECHYQLGLALRENGESDQAEIVLQRWRELNDLQTQLSELNKQAVEDLHNVTLRMKLADVCESLGKHELASMWRKVAQGLQAGSQRSH